MSTIKRLLLLVPFVLLLVPSNAFAEEATPQWTVTSVARPTSFAVGGVEEGYSVTVTNTGGAASNSEPIEVTDEVPPGLTLGAAGASGELSGEGDFHDPLNGSVVNGSVAFSCVLHTCTATAAGGVQVGETLIFKFPVVVTGSPPEAPLCRQEIEKLQQAVVPAAAVSCVTNVVRVSGGGAPAAERQTPTVVYSSEAEAKQETERAGFGISPGSATTALSSVQAGAHSDQTASVSFDTVNGAGTLAGAPKNITYDLPPGFVADFAGTPACANATFLVRECPADTQVGVATISGGSSEGQLEPVYNLTPDPGAVAKIAFPIGDNNYEGSITVRPGDDGGRTVFYNNTAGGLQFDGVSLTVWGVPAAASHDLLRWNPMIPTSPGHFVSGFGASAAGTASVPFFTNPTACTGPLQAGFSIDSWQEPGAEHERHAQMPVGPIVGCDALGMTPSLTAEATTTQAYAATGLNVDMNIPQTFENAEGLATSTLQKAVVTLPAGMTVNPSAGAGLQACSEAQYGEEAVQPSLTGGGCPSESKLGTVEIVTPVLAEKATGSVYLASPYANPFGSLLALYIVARFPDRGVLVRAAGEVQANPVTGQLVTTFDTTSSETEASVPHAGLPAVPFSRLVFSFSPGAAAPLVTPPTCGLYTVQAQLTPWSDPLGAPLTPPIPPFPIDTNCPSGNVAPFNPQVTAYPLHGNAGAYSPLYLKITRNDGEQEITGFASQFPAGLTGNLSGVEKCSEAQVEAARRATGIEEEASPSCPKGSEIGYSIAEAGVGTVLAQTPGKIYLGGPYEGAPFSVVSITAAHVGPFDLGTVVIHFPLEINPETAAVSIPAGKADQIPHIIKGIVIHVRNIRAYVSRNDFMLNPTSCAPSTLSATVIGGGADPTNPADNNPVTAGSPFNATANCQALKFEPKFAVSTSGKTSKANGASLHVDLTYPTGALGNDANIKQVKVELPKQLPSRLTTLQKACTQAQFKANPAGCPAPSLIGTAKAITPILPVPLEGPVYFVSNGGEAFPNLIMVLQGDGVTIDLVGDTFISKSGITSSTFKTVPDQPVSSFELELPEKQYSALAANGNLCGLTKTVTVKKKVTVRVKGKKKTETRKVKETQPTTLQMPTEFVGQNGAVVKQTTAVSVTGCPKDVKASKKHKKHNKGRKKK
jgi:uncharacterized repeat protein (TIGR01451 family)